MGLTLGTIEKDATIEAVENKYYGFSEFVQICIERHAEFDWSEMAEEDIWANQDALEWGGKIMSYYGIPEYSEELLDLASILSFTTVLLITSADRKTTKVMAEGF